MTDQAARQLAQVLNSAAHTLALAGCDSPRLDAEVLLTYVLGQSRAWLYAYPEYVLDRTQLNAFLSLISRRAGREPVAYITGRREFYGLDFVVTSDVLIPRPETEQLVEKAIQWLTVTSPSGFLVDVGTGSGAIAVSLAVHMPQAQVMATDVSLAALALAYRNAIHHGVVDRVHCIQGNLLAPLARGLHLILANPPYLSQAELAAAPPEVAEWEPRSALDGGPDGLATIRDLLRMASERLSPGGGLLVEIGTGQGAEVAKLAHHHFPGASVDVIRDYADLDRLLFVRLAD